MITISQVVDHDMYSDKLHVSFHSNQGIVSLRVKTAFSRDNLEEYFQYQKTVYDVFTKVMRNYNATMANRSTNY